MIIQAPTIFESFNARALTPHQVAATFVPSSQFTELCKRRHTIVLGPRGSGKTTLLKMLQPAALQVWGHPQADAVAAGIDFTGIFVGTDISWSEQLAALGHGKLEPEIQKLLANASFTTHALRSLVVAFQQRCSDAGPLLKRAIRLASLSSSAEAQLVTDVASAWHVKGILPSLFSLKQALTGRLSTIREIASREALLGADGRPQRLANIAFLHLHFVQSASFAIETFEHFAVIQNGKWAYLFDELELAPAWIQDELVKSLRSTEDRFLFKLALNPYTNNMHLLQTATSPAPGQDFDQIALWYAEKRDAYPFCESLWEEILHDRGASPLRPSAVLGKSYFESGESDVIDTGSAYGKGSRWAKKFESLSHKDPTFRSYLWKHNIDVSDLDLKQGTDRAAEIRKIAPIVAVRDFFLKSNAADSSAVGPARGRKSASLYAGADSVFAITEGNPRWFIGLVSRLLASEFDETGKVQPATQGRELFDAAQRFTATLRTIPAPSLTGSVSTSVLQLVRFTGKYFHAETVAGEFKPEPHGSFVVDSKAPDQVVEVLKQALNAGAVVYVPDDDGQLILTSLRGKRFRLSYLLAPLFSFPIRLGKEFSLSKILQPAERKSKRESAGQADLPGLEGIHE